MPVVVMLVVAAQDITGSKLALLVLPIIIIPVMLGGTVAAIYLKRRERLPWGVFYLIWIVPMMAVWCPLVLIRAAILTTLGRPL